MQETVLSRFGFAAFILSAATSFGWAQGTTITPQTPTVLTGRPVGQSTIISPGVSSPSTVTTGISGTGSPCNVGSGAAGSTAGSAGLGTLPGGTTQGGVPVIMSGPGAPSPGSITGVNPSITPGVGSSC